MKAYLLSTRQLIEDENRSRKRSIRNERAEARAIKRRMQCEQIAAEHGARIAERAKLNRPWTKEGR